MTPLLLMHTLGKLPRARRGADPAKVNIELEKNSPVSDGRSIYYS